jgi:hypothetical protein
MREPCGFTQERIQREATWKKKIYRPKRDDRIPRRRHHRPADGVWVGCRRHQSIVKRLRRPHREYREIDHGCAPFFPVREVENPVCMVRAKARIESSGSLELIDEWRGRPLIGSQPAAHIDESKGNQEEGRGYAE